MNTIDHIFKALPYGKAVSATEVSEQTGIPVTSTRRALRQLGRGGGSRGTA